MASESLPCDNRIGMRVVMNIARGGLGLITSHRRSRIRGHQAPSSARSVTCSHRSMLRLSVVTAILAVLLTAPVSSTFGAAPRQTPPIYSSANTGKRVVALTFDETIHVYPPKSCPSSGNARARDLLRHRRAGGRLCSVRSR